MLETKVALDSDIIIYSHRLFVIWCVVKKMVLNQSSIKNGINCSKFQSQAWMMKRLFYQQLTYYDRSAWTHWSAHWWAQKTKILLKNLHTWYLVMFHPLKIFHNFVLNFFGQNHQYWKGTKNIKLNTWYLVYLELVNCHILPIENNFFFT